MNINKVPGEKFVYNSESQLTFTVIMGQHFPKKFHSQSVKENKITEWQQMCYETHGNKNFTPLTWRLHVTSNKKTHHVINNAVAPFLDLNSQPQHYKEVRGQPLAPAGLPKEKKETPQYSTQRRLHELQN